MTQERRLNTLNVSVCLVSCKNTCGTCIVIETILMWILDFSNYFQPPKLTGQSTLYSVIMVLQQFQLKSNPDLMTGLMVQKLDGRPFLHMKFINQPKIN
jgi:hypothetical protein